MVCQLPYALQSTAKLVRMPFVYPAGAMLKGSGRFIVEVGPGRGDFLFHLAKTNPTATVIGIEIKRKRIDKLIARTERHKLSNICLIQDDARKAIPCFFDEKSIDEIHIQFPDPWPKNRHAKNRAVNSDFLKICYEALKTKGFISIITDSISYAEEIRKSAAEVKDLLPCKVNGSDESAYVFPTFFAMKWTAEGRNFSTLRYRRAL